MAKIQEKILVVKLSKLLKDTDTETVILDEESIAQLNAVFEQLAGPGVLVEIDQAQ